MESMLRNLTIAAYLVIMAQGCLSSPLTTDCRSDQSYALDEVRVTATAFMMKPDTDRTVEGERLSSAIESILVYNGRRTETGPGAWVEEIGPDDITSPLSESQLIKWAGKPTEQDSTSMSYLMKRYSESEGLQTESLVILLKRGIVVGTSKSITAKYH